MWPPMFQVIPATEDVLWRKLTWSVLDTTRLCQAPATMWVINTPARNKVD